MTGWMIVTEWLERGVLLTLLGLSVWSVSIMIDRWKYFRLLDEKADTATARRLIAAKDAAGLRKWLGDGGRHPVAGTIKAAMSTEGGGIADAPKPRVVIIQWDSFEQIRAWRNSKVFKELAAEREKLAKLRAFAIEGCNPAYRSECWWR